MTKKVGFFKSFCKVSRAFGTTLNKEELLELIVQNAIDTMGGKAACLFLADKKKDIFQPVAQKGLSENYFHAGPLHTKAIIKTLLEKGFLAIKDATTDSRMDNLEAKKAEGIASILAVPVRGRNKVIGVLTLYTDTQRDFGKDEINFLAALAEQGGIAIGHARLLDRIRKNSMLFLDLASSINSSLDIKVILHNMTAEICEALNMKGVTIRLLDEKRETLNLVASYGLSEEFLVKGPISAKRSIARVVEGETVIIEDVATDKRIQYREKTLNEGIVSILCVPMKSREKVIGVMRLFSAVKRKFPEDIVMLVNALAHTGSMAIQNASLYLSLKEDMESLEKDIWSHRSWF